MAKKENFRENKTQEFSCSLGWKAKNKDEQDGRRDTLSVWLVGF